MLWNQSVTNGLKGTSPRVCFFLPDFPEHWTGHFSERDDCFEHAHCFCGPIVGQRASPWSFVCRFMWHFQKKSSPLM